MSTDATPLNFITPVFQIAYLSSSFRLLSRPHRHPRIKIIVFARNFKDSRHNNRHHIRLISPSTGILTV
ncbi:hypothetical protein L1887_00250 [Cichorium endivia]|nr:hypothetical protein L1887_00250 [Cichorium endivia]